MKLSRHQIAARSQVALLAYISSSILSGPVHAAEHQATISTPVPSKSSMQQQNGETNINGPAQGNNIPAGSTSPVVTTPTGQANEVFNPAVHDHSQEKSLPLKTDPLPSGISPADIPAGPMTELPITPEATDGHSGLSLNKTAEDGTDPNTLTGGASTTAVSNTALMGVARGMTVNPLTRYKGPRMVYIELTIRNTSDQPIVLLGDGIRGQAAGKTVYPIGYDKIVKLDNNVMSTTKKLEVAALGAGSLGLTSSIAYEWLAPQEYRKRNPGTAVGRDRGRHEIEEGRFNRRVLLPADETTGWVGFYATDAETLSSLTLPLLLPPYTINSGSISIPIYGANVAYKASQEDSVNGKPNTIYSIK